MYPVKRLEDNLHHHLNKSVWDCEKILEQYEVPHIRALHTAIVAYLAAPKNVQNVAPALPGNALPTAKSNTSPKQPPKQADPVLAAVAAQILAQGEEFTNHEQPSLEPDVEMMLSQLDQ